MIKGFLRWAQYPLTSIENELNIKMNFGINAISRKSINFETFMMTSTPMQIIISESHQSSKAYGFLIGNRTLN